MDYPLPQFRKGFGLETWLCTTSACKLTALLGLPSFAVHTQVSRPKPFRDILQHKCRERFVVHKNTKSWFSVGGGRKQVILHWGSHILWPELERNCFLGRGRRGANGDRIITLLNVLQKWLAKGTPLVMAKAFCTLYSLRGTKRMALGEGGLLSRLEYMW